MYQIKYECGLELQAKAKSNWSRIVDANGRVVYKGTYSGGEQWLRDRHILPLYAGHTHAERQ